jgi:putative flippase GtrA
MLSTLLQDRRSMLLQLTRFVISGALVTALGVGVYAFVALVLRWHPQLGNFLAYAVAVATGYVMHSRWSFRGHGGQRDHRTRVRFIIVSLISYALNSSWVWLFTKPLLLGPAWPMVPMVFVTPVVTFTLNRQWVFR